MKKLISIKSDESGENIYFTHKNGVDVIRKDDVIDLKTQKKYGFYAKIKDMLLWWIFCIICIIFYQFSDIMCRNLAFRGNNFHKEWSFLYFMNDCVFIFGLVIFTLVLLKMFFFSPRQGKLVIFFKKFQKYP